jgi:hypothetical protein
LFGEKTSVAAPTFYALSKNDQTISPDLERFLATRMQATTVELDAVHLSLVSHSKQVADLILTAAGQKKLGKSGPFFLKLPDPWQVN